MSKHDHDRRRDWYADPCLGCTLGTPRNPRSINTMTIGTLKRQNAEGITTAGEEREAIGDRWNDDRIGKA